MTFDAYTSPFSETRSNIENPTVPVSAANFLEFFGLESRDLPRVTIDSALGVPAYWAGSNFLSGTIAGLPLNVYQRTAKGRVKLSTGIARVLHDAVNDETTSFQWRKGKFDQVFTAGRGYSWVEKDAAGEVINIWPLPYTAVTPRRVRGRRVYDYRENGNVTTFDAKDIIDIPMMLKADGVRHYSPILTNRDTIALAIAVTRYGLKFFNNGGVPALAVEGPFKTAAGLDRSGKDLTKSVAEQSKDGRQVIALPDGHKISPIGIDPEKLQMVEVKRFVIEEIARILSLPPVFLQDLTHGTFSNTEQQDLHLTKHTIKRWIEQFEQELNLKLFGRENAKGYYVKFALDGLLRGDFKARMEGYALAIQNAILRPNEVREMDDREADPDGDLLMVQGATVPVRNQKNPKPPKDKTA